MSCLVNHVIFWMFIFSCRILRWIGRLHPVVVLKKTKEAGTTHLGMYTPENHHFSAHFRTKQTMFPPLIRPSFSQILGRGWNNIVLTNWLHFPGTCSQNSPKQRSLQKFRESFDIDFWLQVLLVVPLHQRMDLGGLGDQDHGSFGADV